MTNNTAEFERVGDLVIENWTTPARRKKEALDLESILRVFRRESRQHSCPARIIQLTLALTPGTRLGVYEVTAQIGEGGMGQVYRATDTTLGRQVAIKILPDALAADPDRLVRFEREAKTLASLNHPHIAAIYGFEKSAGTHALVMELVEGDDLSQKLAGLRARGSGLPIDEALSIAKQIAEALEAAHEQGIVHRDLKPANIKVRPDGTVKVLDFGLAKVIEPVSAMSVNAMTSPTRSIHATQAGIILGTAAYMSPEQAAGKPVDKRSDLWAFGVVLFEMLTGRQLFDGETVTHVIAAVLTKEPDWTVLPAATPSIVRRLLRRCLEKDPRRRLHDVADARLEIDDAIAAPAMDAPAPTGRFLWRTAAAIVVTALASAALGWYLKPSSKHEGRGRTGAFPHRAVRADVRDRGRARHLARWPPRRVRCGTGGPAATVHPRD